MVFALTGKEQKKYYSNEKTKSVNVWLSVTLVYFVFNDYP